MKKKLIFLFSIVFLLLSSVINANNINSKVDDIVEEKLLEQEKVSVIVILKDSQIKSVSKKGVSVKQLNVKERVLEKLDKEEFEKKRDFGSFNGFSGEINKGGLEKLKLDENVEKIIIDKPVKAFLTESIPIINGTLVHNLQINGINFTGVDQTICVVDTGVNSTHEDLSGKVIAQKCYCQVEGVNCCIGNTNEADSAEDDQGHGTQMAGIIAANGNLIGVAPDSKIISVKVLNASGIGTTTNTINGIEWCIANKDNYNITVISLSLGTSPYGNNNYCDSDRPDYAFVINNATQNNISVIAASGNDVNYTALSAPACIENTTSVGAVYDANVGQISWTGCTDITTDVDNITCFTNRNSILNLLAPGAMIISTSMNGGNSTPGGGTSQATPHVAGAVALLKQYANLELNRNLDNNEIKTTLNNTGVGIYDSLSDYTFSRIDVYEALKSLDNVTPRITISLISDVIEYGQQNLTININYEDVFLDSYTANVSYPNGTLLIEFNDNLELTTETLSELGSYTIIAWVNDTNGNENLTSKTFLVQDTTSLNESSFDLIYPIDGNITGNELVYFNVTVGSKYNLSNITLYHNFTDWSANESLNLDTNETSVEFNSSFSDGRYVWGVNACDINNYCNFSNNRTLIVDLTNPIVNAINTTSYSTNNVVLHYNVTDYEISDCKLFINDELNETANPVIDIDQTLSKFLYNGDYNWSVNCTDSVGLIGVSDTIFINVACTESWSCTDWSPSTCPEAQQQTRTCSDINNCGTTNSKPAVSQSCTYTGNATSTSPGTTSPGGAATTTSLTESVLIFSGLANDVKSFGISKDVGIEGVSITLNNAVTNAKLTVKKLDSNPTSSNLDNVYNYIQIDTNGLTSEDIKEASIKFKVGKSWINTNAAGVNYVYMQRYNNGKWEKLETLTAGADDNYQKYQASTLGFSYFAINAEKASNIITTNAVSEEINGEIATTSVGNITNKSKFSFKSLFSGNAIKNLTDKISFKNIISKKTIYNVIFVAVIFLMLAGVTYRYRGVIFKNVRRKGNVKFKHKDYGIKKTFTIFGEHAKEVEKKEIGSIVNGIKKLEEIKNDKLNEMRVNRLAKLKEREEERIVRLKLKQEEDAIKSKTREEERVLNLKQEENEKAMKLKKQEEERAAKGAAKRAKEEKYEIKERDDKNEFDVESDWDEGD